MPRFKLRSMVTRACGLVFKVSLCAITWHLTANAQPSAPTQLTPGQPVEKTLSGGATHSYAITTVAGQYLRVTLDQRGIDLKFALFAPDNKPLAEIDFFQQGRPETIVWIAETVGAYRLDVLPAEKTAARGLYQISLNELRTPTETDRQRVSAQQAFLAAEQLIGENKAEPRRQAIPHYEQALQTWRSLSEASNIAVTLYALSENYRALNQTPQALDYCQQALAQWRAVGDREAEAGTLTNLAGLYNASNQKEQAIETYQQGLALFRTLGLRDDEAAALSSLGTLFLNQGEPKKAQEHFTQAVALRRALNDRGGEAIALNNLGEAQRQLGDKRQALKSFQAALTLRRAVNNAAGITTSLNSICAVFIDLGEMQQALDACAQSLARQRTATTLNNLGRIYDLLGAPQEALQNYEQALQIARAATAPAARLAEARTLNFMGLAHWAAGNNAQAIDHINQSLPLSRTAKNPATEAAAYNNLGLIYNSIGEWAKALETLNQALPLMRQTGNRQYEAIALNNIGFAYEGLRDQNRAFEAHNQALKLARDVRDRQREAKINFGLARLERERGRLKQARKQIENTIEIVEAARAKLTDPNRRAEYRAATQQYYDLYIDVLMRLHKRVPKDRLNATALQVSERARARSLIELLIESNADLRADAAPELVERERELQDKLNDKTTEQLTLLTGKATAAKVTAITQELDQLTAELRTAQNQIRASSPRYAALTQPQPLSATEIQRQVLAPNTLLLEYALGEDHSYLWALTSNTLRSFTLPKRSEIEPVARRFYTALSTRSQDTAELRAASATLSKMLLAPVASLLGNKRLMIVADGALQYVPFAALSDAGRQSAIPLFVNHEIINLPSASTLAVLRNESRGKPPATKQLSVLADPVFERQDERIKTIEVKPTKPATPTADPTETSRILLKKAAQQAGVANATFSIPRLPFTRTEAEAILALAPATERQASFDFAASRASATNTTLGESRIVHFATHGFLNSLNPELSGLVLSLVDEQGAAQNGYLLAPEFYSMRLPATELAVLSACQTGLGKEVRGEGLIGLTRGLMYAGAPRVVVSLWSVNDQATSELMKAFYQGVLGRHQRPAAALRTAQLVLWKQKQWRAPYYWAAFTLQGEWR